MYQFYLHFIFYDALLSKSVTGKKNIQDVIFTVEITISSLIGSLLKEYICMV